MFSKIKESFAIWMLKRLIMKHASLFMTSMSFNQAPELSEVLQTEKGLNQSKWVKLNIKVAQKLFKWAKRLNIETSIGIYEDWYNKPHTAHTSHGLTIGIMLYTNKFERASELLVPTSISVTNIGIFVPLSVNDLGLGEYKSPLDPYTFNPKYYRPNPNSGYWYSKTETTYRNPSEEFSSEKDFRSYQKTTVH